MTQLDKFAIVAALFGVGLLFLKRPAVAAAGAGVTASPVLPWYLSYNQGFTGSSMAEVAVPSSNAGEIAASNGTSGSAVPSSNGNPGAPCLGCGGAIFNTSGVTQL